MAMEPAMRSDRGLTVGALARETGVTAHTVRYYEREGLLLPPERSPAGYRHYGNDAVERLRFIQGAQQLGLRLRQIRDLLAMRDSGSCPCGSAGDLLRQRMHDIDTEISRLVSLRAQLGGMVTALPSAECRGPAPGINWRPEPHSGPPGADSRR
ncbi:heavy metal-responsive transcriptional regulator [Streptomyces sp. NBC_01511]|uniref:heavy metal-responsive transcriptional regulator n=1 Tax=unclassified Streptomyces TaxID=2593676 RepID=UPI0038686A39